MVNGVRNLFSTSFAMNLRINIGRWFLIFSFSNPVLLRVGVMEAHLKLEGIADSIIIYNDGCDDL